MEYVRTVAAFVEWLGHSLKDGYLSRCLSCETFSKSVLTYELFNALHGYDTGTATPYKNQKLTAVLVGTALRLTDGASYTEVEDCGTKEMLKFIHIYHVMFFADRRLPKDGVKLEMLECFCSR